MQLNTEQGCPDFGCEEFMDAGCLVVQADPKDYLIRRVAAGASYPSGTPLMNGPNAALVKWDGLDINDFVAINYRDIDLALAESSCPENVLGGNACINPKEVCWPEGLEDEDILVFIQEKSCCLRFEGIWANCHISEADEPLVVGGGEKKEAVVETSLESTIKPKKGAK